MSQAELQLIPRALIHGEPLLEMPSDYYIATSLQATGSLYDCLHSTRHYSDAGKSRVFECGGCRGRVFI